MTRGATFDFAAWGWLGLTLLLGCGGGGGCGSGRRTADAPAAATGSAPSGPVSPAPIDDDDRAPAASAGGPLPQVTIRLSVDAHWKAHVFWGRKDLGIAPLQIQRPRGSGPLDLLIVADDALPLHTRVFTDRNSALAVRLYSESEAPGLLGYPRTFSLPTSTRFTHNAGTFPRPRR